MQMRLCGLALLALFLAPAAGAVAPPPPGSVLPPPGINDPGAKPKTQSVPLPDTGIPPSLAPAARQQAGNGDSTNIGTRVNASGDVVQQSGSGGAGSTVRVVPKHGVPQTYRRTSPSGSLVPDPRLGPVSPVYYDVYDWGVAKKPASGQSG